MRHIFAGIAAALIGLGAAPAVACGGHGCTPCAYAAPCGVVYSGYGYHYVDYERLPTIAVPRWHAVPQYYYVDQGPTYAGPGAFAPLPAYRQRAVRSRYSYGYSYGDGYGVYRGGPYANAMHHYYAGAPAWHGPAIVRYRPRAQNSRRHGVRHRHTHHHHRLDGRHAGQHRQHVHHHRTRHHPGSRR